MNSPRNSSGRFLLFGPVLYFRVGCASDLDAWRRAINFLFSPIREFLENLQPVWVVVERPVCSFALAALQLKEKLAARALKVRRFDDFVNRRSHIVEAADKMERSHGTHVLLSVMSVTSQSPR